VAGRPSVLVLQIFDFAITSARDLSAFIPLRSGRERPSKPEHLAAQLNKLRDAVADLIVCSLALK
jgi:hypothetical protein